MARQEAVGSVASRPVKPRTAWLLGGLGAAAAALGLRRRPEPVPPARELGPDPRAAQLREKLEESRAAVEELERERAEDGETPVDEAVPAADPEPEEEPEADASSVEERRRRVHERGRATARKMRKQPGDE
jgi:hypothetical protein